MIQIILILLIPSLLLSKNSSTLTLDNNYKKAYNHFNNGEYKDFKQIESELSNSKLLIDKQIYLKCLLSIVEYRERNVGMSFQILKMIQESYFLKSDKFVDINYSKSNYYITLGNLFSNLRNYKNASIQFRLSLYHLDFVNEKIDSIKIKKQKLKENLFVNIVTNFYNLKELDSALNYTRYIRELDNKNFVKLIKFSKLNDKENFLKLYDSTFTNNIKNEYIELLKIKFSKNVKNEFYKSYLIIDSKEIINSMELKNDILYEAFETNNLDYRLKDSFLVVLKQNEELIKNQYSNFISDFLLNKQISQNLNIENQFKNKYINILTYSIFFSILGLFFVIFASFYLYKGFKKQKNLNKELNFKKLELQSLIKTKDEILTILSHDIKTPLVGMKMLIETLNLKNSNNENDKHSVKNIWKFFKQTLDSTIDMTLNILTYSKAIEQNDYIIFELVSIKEIIEHQHSIIISYIDSKKITINYKLEDLNILTDKIYFEAVYRNILSNAIKFTIQKGTIKVELNDKQLSITNYNSSISKEKIESILNEKFEKVESSKGSNGEIGSGYGMKIVNRTIKYLNLKLNISSNDEETTFTIIFN